MGPDMSRIRSLTMHALLSFGDDTARFMACLLVLLCAATRVPAQQVEHPAEQEVLKAATRNGSIPLSEPVWVDENGMLKKLEPGTEKYFHARVEGLYYVSDNGLAGCVKMLFRIVDHASGGVLAAHMTPAVDQSADTEVRGLVPGQTFVISTSATNEFPVGMLMGCNVAPGAAASVTTASGRPGTFPILHIVEPVSLEQYVKMWNEGRLAVTPFPPTPEPAMDDTGTINAAASWRPARSDGLPAEELTDRQLSTRLYDLRRNKAQAQRRTEWLKASIAKIEKVLAESTDADRTEVLRDQFQLRTAELQQLESEAIATDGQLLDAVSELDRRRR